jgi:hypothetical protein
MDTPALTAFDLVDSQGRLIGPRDGAFAAWVRQEEARDPTFQVNARIDDERDHERMQEAFSAASGLANRYAIMAARWGDRELAQAYREVAGCLDNARHDGMNDLDALMTRRSAEQNAA